MLSILTVRRPGRKPGSAATASSSSSSSAGGRRRPLRSKLSSWPGWLLEIVQSGGQDDADDAEAEDAAEEARRPAEASPEAGQCRYFHRAIYGEPVVPRLRICTPD